VADFVGNPSINFVDVKGSQQPDGSFLFTLIEGRKAIFHPTEEIQMEDYWKQRDRDRQRGITLSGEWMKDKKHVEKGNKDEAFRYHIPRVNEEDYGIREEPEITNEDFVLGIRPEYLVLHEGDGLEADIYGAMPTGMESTVKLRVGDYLLTSVVFGKGAYAIGEKTHIQIQGEDILLYDRSSGKYIGAGSLEIIQAETLEISQDA
jgi:hypothetical protein